jgi:hypothetical protein
MGWKTNFVSRNMIPQAICLKWLSENNWRSLRSLWPTPSTISGLVFTIYMWRIAAIFGCPIICNTAVWVLHVEASAHSSRSVMRYLDSRFPSQWIGRNGPIVWSPRSPDLTPADLYLWVHLEASFIPNDLTRGTSCGKPLEWLWR